MQKQQQTRAPATSRKAAGPTSAPASATRGNAYASGRHAASSTGQDPASFKDAAGHAIRHSEPDGREAFNWERERTMGMCANRDVMIFHDEKNPLVGSTPSEDALYVDRDPVGVSEPGWDTVERIVGSVDAPYRNPKVDTRAIFVDGTPSVDDIHQGQIGDCYFLAALGSVVASDPARVKKMISLSGNNAVVTLHRYDEAASTWIPVTISVSTDLAQTTDEEGDDTGLLGSSFRIGKEPTKTAWHADVIRNNLAVQEDQYFEASLWVPLMEKAFARYAEQYGQYGGFDSENANAQADDEGAAKSGYQVIEGGWAENIFPVVYGPDVLATDSTSMEFKAGGDVIADNEEAVRNLLRVGGDGVEKDKAFHMTCGMDRDTAVERLDDQLALVVASGAVDATPGFKRELEYLRTIVRGWRAKDNDEKVRAKLGQAVKEAVAPGAWPVLQSGRAHGDFRDLRDLMLVVANIDTDGNKGQRLTYAWHSYTVLGADWQDREGKALGVTQANLDAQKGTIDPSRSRVKLRNPHGTNEPDPSGKGTAEGADDGSFSLSLETFFRVFSFQEHGLVKR